MSEMRLMPLRLSLIRWATLEYLCPSQVFYPDDGFGIETHLSNL